VDIYFKNGILLLDSILFHILLLHFFSKQYTEYAVLNSHSLADLQYGHLPSLECFEAAVKTRFWIFSCLFHTVGSMFLGNVEFVLRFHGLGIELEPV